MMGILNIRGVRLAGIAASVPEARRRLEDDGAAIPAEEREKLMRAIGVRERRIAPPEICTSDLCYAAATRLLADLAVDPVSVDALIFVTQSPDYELPATACVLQAALGLPDTAAAFDINLGCSGYVYGLWLASQIVAAGGARRLLLLVGDTSTRRTAPEDRGVFPLFGDAGSATLLERDKTAGPLTFSVGTDGRGFETIIIPSSGFRQPRSSETAERQAEADGVARAAQDIHLNGPEVFNFTLRRVPPLVKEVLTGAGWTIEDLDHVVFHQANAFMLRHLGKRLAVPEAKLVLAMERFGNTSSASIPLAMVDALGPALTASTQKLLLAGFGVGMSWGALACETGPLTISPLVELAAPMALGERARSR
jgi:3-oxoacyl-[acyl-carrier-protein] synthase-3